MPTNEFKNLNVCDGKKASLVTRFSLGNEGSKSSRTIYNDSSWNLEALVNIKAL